MHASFQVNRFWIKLVVLAVWVLASVLPQTAFSQFEGWHHDLASARQEARSSHKSLLILFVHEGCPECARMERSLASSQAQQALEPFAKAVLEFDENRDIALRYNIEFTPTLLIYGPDGGGCLVRHVGALSSSGISQLARRILAKTATPVSSSKTQTVESNPGKPGEEKQKAVPQATSLTWKTAQRRYLDLSPSREGSMRGKISYTGLYRECHSAKTQPRR